MSWLDKLLKMLKPLEIRLPRPPDTVLMREVVAEASKWIGVSEIKGQGSVGVNVFRRATDGVAEGEPWCAAFVQYCITAVSIRYKTDISLHASELCSAIWENTPKRCRLNAPLPGSIIIWNYPGTIQGHTGIVLRRLDNNKIKTIEGNTRGEDTPSNIRGVFTKIRSVTGDDNMKVLGFINPFG